MRWFLPGDPPDPWRRWFEGLPSAGPEERTDVYLALDTSALGVKLREHEHGRRPFSGAGDAAMEGWRKWSLPQRRWGTPRRRLPWIEVRKVRWMVTYALNPSGAATLTEGGPEDGCSVELARLRAAGQDWCTVGFEAFGSDDRRLEALVAAGDAVFAQLPDGHGLEAALSCAYPEWLRTLP